jgi:hypothetical protein
MVKGVVRKRVEAVESGITTPGPLKNRVLSRKNHQVPMVLPLKVACPTPSRKAVLLGRRVAPG